MRCWTGSQYLFRQAHCSVKCLHDWPGEGHTAGFPNRWHFLYLSHDTRENRNDDYGRETEVPALPWWLYICHPKIAPHSKDPTMLLITRAAGVWQPFEVNSEWYYKHTFWRRRPILDSSHTTSEKPRSGNQVKTQPGLKQHYQWRTKVWESEVQTQPDSSNTTSEERPSGNQKCRHNLTQATLPVKNGGLGIRSADSTWLKQHYQWRTEAWESEVQTQPDSSNLPVKNGGLGIRSADPTWLKQHGGLGIRSADPIWLKQHGGLGIRSADPTWLKQHGGLGIRSADPTWLKQPTSEERRSGNQKCRPNLTQATRRPGNQKCRPNLTRANYQWRTEVWKSEVQTQPNSSNTEAWESEVQTQPGLEQHYQWRTKVWESEVKTQPDSSNTEAWESEVQTQPDSSNTTSEERRSGNQKCRPNLTQTTRRPGNQKCRPNLDSSNTTSEEQRSGNQKWRPNLTQATRKPGNQKCRPNLTQATRRSGCRPNLTRATLPVKNQGLGIRSAVQLAPSVYLASAVACTELVCHILPPQIRSSIPTPYQEEAKIMWSQGLDTITHWRHQRTPPEGVGLCKSASNYQCLDGRSFARLMATSSQDSGVWLFLRIMHGRQPHPSGSRTSAWMLPVQTTHMPSLWCQCGCLATHGRSCRQSKGRHFRHSSINDLIYRALLAAIILSRLEPSGIYRSGGKRPDSITMVP